MSHPGNDPEGPDVPSKAFAAVTAAAEEVEAPARRQAGTVFLVQLDGREPFEVRVDNRDRIRWEKTRGPRGWPAATEAQSFAMTFLTWSAAKRAGHPAAGKFEEWEADLIDWDQVREAPADPTRATPSPAATSN
jgi:hypothetical protein